MKNKVFIIPGLGDGVNKTIWITNHWRNYSLEPVVYSARWNSEENFKEKLTKLLGQIDLCISNGDNVSLVGCSAGASMVLNAFLERKNVVNKVVSICGRLRTGNQKGFRSLEVRSKHSPSFFESVKLFENKEHILSPADKNRIMTIRSLFGDELVPSETAILTGAHNITIPVAEHSLSIIMTLIFSNKLINFLKQCK